MSTGRMALNLILGVIMSGLGLLIIVRLIAYRGEALTPAPLLDALFAAFFLFRGGMLLRAAARMHRSSSLPPDDRPLP